MLEKVTGDEAAYIFLSHLKLRGDARVIGGMGVTEGGRVADGVRASGGIGVPVGVPGGMASGREAGLGVAREAGSESGRDLQALRGLPYLRQLACHLAEFPYENISKIIKVSAAPRVSEALRLPTEVVTDHLDRNFGGTCFSLTFLFERLLKAAGFDCYKVMADMHSGPNVHCLVVVREGGAKYIVDPGYALYEVMPLPQGAAGASERVRCPHAVVELERAPGASGPGGGPSAPGAYNLWTEDASGRKWRYRFVDAAAPDGEFEGHWIESFSKPTLNNICLTRMTPRGHIYLRKDFFKFTSPTAVEKRRLAGGREKLIEEEFGIRGEWVETAQGILDEKRASARQAGKPQMDEKPASPRQAGGTQMDETRTSPRQPREKPQEKPREKPGRTPRG